MTLEERKKRVLTKGSGNHAHVLIGNVEFKQDTFIVEKDNDCKLVHIDYNSWINSGKIIQAEHKEISLAKGEYQYIPQIEYDPYAKVIREVID